jgi:serine phosphatase RsbU (regulator of sigma subunit)
VLTAVRAFAGDAPQSDDITILTLKYLAQRKRVA